MSSASTVQPGIELITTFEVSHAQRPTLSVLCNKLELLASNNKSLLSETPLAVQANYILSARASYRSKDSGLGWHLRSPTAANVVALSCEALVRGGYVQPGQVVQAAGSKLLSDNSSNVLIVTIVKLDSNCYEDSKTLPHKLLDWYLEQCSIKNIPPTRVVYRSLLKKLRNKPPKNGGQDYTTMNLGKVKPKFIEED